MDDPGPGYQHWYTAHLRDHVLTSTTARQDAAKQMQQLLDLPAWGMLMALLDAREKREMVTLQKPGGVPDHATYARVHGIIEGMASIRGATEAVLRVAEQAETKALKAAESAG